MLLVFGPMHEPWPDEAQAWLLARDLPLHSLLFHFLRHEGHPGLWYTVLWAATRLHLPYSLIWTVSCGAAITGVWVLLRCAPFPFFVKALLPFSFFLAYQYSVVARSYALFPLVGFLVAHVYRDRRPRPVLFGVLLGLLANISIHGTFVALGFVVPYARGVLRAEHENAPDRRRWCTGAGIFAASVVLVGVCLWPTVDALPRVSPTMNRVIDAVSIHENDPLIPAARARYAAIEHVTEAPGRKPIPDLPPLPPGAPKPSKLANIPEVLGFAVAPWWPLAVAFEALCVVYLVRTGQPGLLLPLVLLVGFLVGVYAAAWHLGLLWVTLIMVLWAAWQPALSGTAKLLQQGVAWSLALLCVLQLPWTYEAFRFDAANPTSPDKAAAAYLKTLQPGLRVAGFGMATGIQPYFDHNIFFNQELTFTYFSLAPYLPNAAQVLATRPDVVVTDATALGLAERAGYRQMREFCGTLFMPKTPLTPACLSVLARPVD